jgi:hypothetical protein
VFGTVAISISLNDIGIMINLVYSYEIINEKVQLDRLFLPSSYRHSSIHGNSVNSSSKNVSRYAVAQLFATRVKNEIGLELVALGNFILFFLSKRVRFCFTMTHQRCSTKNTVQIDSYQNDLLHNQKGLFGR